MTCTIKMKTKLESLYTKVRGLSKMRWWWWCNSGCLYRTGVVYFKRPCVCVWLKFMRRYDDFTSYWLKSPCFRSNTFQFWNLKYAAWTGWEIFLDITQFYLSNNMLACSFQRILDPSPHVHLLMRIIETKNVPYLPHVRIQIWIKIIFFDNLCASYSDKPNRMICTGQNVSWAQVHCTGTNFRLFWEVDIVSAHTANYVILNNE